MFAATDLKVLSSQIARAAARMSPEQGVSPAPPAAGWRPDLMTTLEYSTGATAQWRGSDMSEGTLLADVVTRAVFGSAL